MTWSQHSGSGLDPHVYVESAYQQIPRVARNRGMSEQALTNLVDQFIEKRNSVFGDACVNVLMLNHALDGIKLKQMNQRPDPDELLKNVIAGESTHGKLKIFLGYAAGVGKTYAMLEAAQQRQKQGVDVVIGYVETHGRADTEAMVQGLEELPLLQVTYHGIQLYELDIDAIINRHPEIVLIDEFAHTNSPGSRHPKRYLDVEDILSKGIDVYTTLNIQHLESLNDVVAQITGVVVKETIPDRVLDEAARSK